MLSDGGVCCIGEVLRINPCTEKCADIEYNIMYSDIPTYMYVYVGIIYIYI